MKLNLRNESGGKMTSEEEEAARKEDTSEA